MRMIRSSGFTIVELLIVVVVISILAAIGIITYSGVQKRAYETAISSDYNQFAKQMAIYKSLHGEMPDAVNELETFDIKFTGDHYNETYLASPLSVLYCVNNVTGQWGVGAVLKNTNEIIINENGKAKNQGEGGDLTNCEDGAHVGAEPDTWGVWKSPSQSWSEGITCVSAACS